MLDFVGFCWILVFISKLSCLAAFLSSAAGTLGPEFGGRCETAKQRKLGRKESGKTCLEFNDDATVGFSISKHGGKIRKKSELVRGCEECLGVFASNASNLANEAGGCPSFSSTCNASVDA